MKTRWSWIVLLTLGLMVFGCSDEGTPDDGSDIQQTSDIQPEPDENTDEECTQDSDCGELSACVLAVGCDENICSVVRAEPGTSCEEGCLIGTCDAEGACKDTYAKECPENDGNLCTVPTCDYKNGACSEEPMPEGDPPYAESACWVGAICVDGSPDNTNANPSEMAVACEQMSEEVDGDGCIDHYVCVGGDVGCQAVVKPDGNACWIDEGGTSDVCAGHSCQEGDCVPDGELDIPCTQENFPTDCEEDCQNCTELTCHWVADPDGESGRFSYCKPTALVEDACDSNPCLVDQACVLSAQSDGLLGKETLGGCGAGTEKSKEVCIAELGLSELGCILAGMACDPENGGCGLNSTLADSWCLPSSSQCFNAAETYCTHLDTGENWNEETGCNTVAIDIDCDDSNVCTVDTCTNAEEGLVCEHAPVEGAACDDGDLCTTTGLCAGSECAGIVPLCIDGDDNACTDLVCNPETDSGCETLTLDSGICDDDDVCTQVDSCTGGVCVGSSPLACEDGDVCTTGDCDPATGCVSTNNNSPCNDGIGCTMNDACNGGNCQGTFYNCNDNDFCTEDLCTGDGECDHSPAPNGVPCNGGAPWSCQDGECVCAAQCDDFSCGDDGCGGTCGCPVGKECIDSFCVTSSGGSPYDGQWYVTANPDSQMLAGIAETTFIPIILDLTINGADIQATTNVLGITINYSGIFTDPDFTWTGYYSDSGGGSHVETWDCTFDSEIQFTGTAEDKITILGFPLGTLVWNVTGVKQ